MPRVLGVHGIAQQRWGGPQLTNSWWLAMRGGLEAAGHRKAADALPEEDVRVAFYGEFFRPPGSKAGYGPPYTPASLSSPSELELLKTWYCQATAEEPQTDVGEGPKGLPRVAAQVMLHRLLRTATFAGVAERALIGDLKQVTAFLTDTSTKERVLQRISSEMTKDTKVVIGHSLGSVVAYEYLALYAPPQVELLITLGSPLGIPRLVFDRLTPVPTSGVGVWPGTVARWVNIADKNDIVALAKQLAPLFPTANAGYVVEDCAVDNGKSPHGVEPYLTSSEAGLALATIL